MEEKLTITPELREQAKKLSRAAALLKPADRNDFLTVNCANDARLRSEVEKLLRYLHKETNVQLEKPALDTNDLTLSRTKANGQKIPKDFMGQPVFEIVAEHLAQAMSRADNETLPDELLKNRYRLVKVIKQGGMGIVFEAHDSWQKNSADNGGGFASVAVKKNLRNDFENEPLWRQFENEASLLGKLKHPALSKFKDYFTEGGYQYLIMEFVPGKDIGEQLSEHLKESRRGFPIEQVLQWADELLDVLEYLHSQSPSVVHRDIKPANLKLSEQNKIILLDFGIAKEFSGQPNYTLTRNVAAGTPDYASPEQLEGKATTQSTDIYSLAATLFHFATGVAPHRGDKRREYVESGHRDPLQLDRNVIKDVPLKIAEVLHRAMSIRAEDRPSATEMRKALLKARLHVSLNDMLTSVVTNVAEIYAAVRKALKTQASIAAGAISAKYKSAKDRLSAVTAASFLNSKSFGEFVDSILSSKSFGEFVDLIIFKLAPLCLFLWLLGWYQSGEKLPRRSTPLPANQYVLAPPSSNFSNKPTRSNAESYLHSNTKEFWTSERFFSFGDSYHDYSKKEKELENLNFSLKNYKAIKRLAREQIKLLNDFAEVNREAAEASEITLPAHSARTNIKHVEILLQRAKLLLKFDADSAQMIIKKREQLKLRADQFKLKMPRIHSGNPADRSPSYESNTVVAETGL